MHSLSRFGDDFDLFGLFEYGMITQNKWNNVRAIIIQGDKKMKKIRNLAIIGCVLASLCVLTACNTIRGMGEDIEHGGHEIKKSAE